MFWDLLTLSVKERQQRPTPCPSCGQTAVLTNPSLFQCACKGRCINKQCRCRKGKMTCGENCQCDHEKCRNMEERSPAVVTDSDQNTLLPTFQPVADRQGWSLLFDFRISVRQKVSPETRRLFKINRPSVPTTPPSSSRPRARPLKRYTPRMCFHHGAVLQHLMWTFSTAGVKGNRRHGARSCGSEAG